MTVSKEELSVIISQVQSKLLWYMITTIIPLVVGGTVGVMTIRGDISHNATVSHSENVSLKHYVDSLHHDTESDINSIRTTLSSLPIPKTTIIKQTIHPKPAEVGLYTQRYINGQLGWFRVN